MDSTSTLATAKADVFGDKPVLGTDGQPLERGVGSPWHRADHLQKARFHAATAWDAAGEMVSLVKQLTAVADRISAAMKASVEAAQAAKDEPAVQPIDVKDTQAFKDLKDQFDRAVAERDVLTRLPAATAHNVARDAAEQKLLDDYRAEQERAAKQKIEDARLAKEKADADEKAKKMAADAAAAQASPNFMPGQAGTPGVPSPAVPNPDKTLEQQRLDKAAADAAARAAAFDKPPVPVLPIPVKPAEDTKLSFLGG